MRSFTLIVILLAACDGSSLVSVEGEGDPTASAEEKITVCAGGPTVRGVDVSEYQGNIDWNAVAGAGYGFAIARIGDGHYMDPTFQRNWAGIAGVGMIRGAYQFFEPNVSAADQANLVVSAVGRLGPGDLPVTLDVEWTSGAPNAAMIQQWVDIVSAGTGKQPMIYTALGYWNQYFNGQFGGLPLWVANWGVSCPSLPNSWGSWVIWQWGGQGVPGIPNGSVDGDVFNGTIDQLRGFAGGAGFGSGGCTAAEQAACGAYGANCVDHQCNGGTAPGTGCSSAEMAACGAYGANCVDHQCNGGTAPGTGCTWRETHDCAQFASNCVDHQCNGGTAPGTGCTWRETHDCGAFGSNCVDHQCNGGTAPGTGCTLREMLDCGAYGSNCVDHQCNGGTATGTGCTFRETHDCGVYGANCVDHKCNGGVALGTGCTWRETHDCGAYGANCVDHQCNGGTAPGSGCTFRETHDCNATSCGCVDHACSGGSCSGTGCTFRETYLCHQQNQSCELAVCK